ncbi:septum formation initiator family protein [Micrococcus sp. TA1]|uniref:septum formation initiator family protein n=1 Tax=Micrococcus sp. TA1 TaxID=681627 RepID=UPI0017F10DD3|nr:cell division protein FtsB [Micrococcus sp. TA1]
MATRRPRVPKSARPSAQRSLVATGTAGRTTCVTGHSAKVIPLDAAPSLHVGDAPADASGRPAPSAAHSAHRDPASVRARTPAGAAAPARAVGPEASEDAETTPEETAPEATTAPRPTLTAAERRAAARRDLLRRARPGGTPAARTARPSPGPSRPAVVEPVPARNFSGRSVALLVVLFVAAVLLAPTLRVYLDQQAELRAVQEDISAQQEEQRRLTAQIARWDDPAYIQQQARDRFNLVMPGEKAYMVIGGDQAVEDPVPGPASPGQVNPDMPWADALWDSVVRAGTD